MSLAALTAQLRAAPGIAHKQDIAPILARLALGHDTAIPVGDDCAAIPDGDGFLLLAIEGFMPGFIAADPHFAGFCGIMVNLSDIAAMGGRPIAVVDAIWSQDAAHAEPLLAGLAEASRTYNIPIAGGHTNTRAGADLLSVAILGRARKLLTSFDAKPGDSLIAAIDLRGTLRKTGPYWDAATGAPPARLRENFLLLPAIAEAGLCAAAKDISMAGVIGTALMLLEASHCGAALDLAAIPRPPEIPLESWLHLFPSFGFILSVPPENTAAVLGKFAAQKIAAAIIGEADASTRIRLRLGAEETLFWDLAEQNLTGCRTERANA